MPDVFTKDLSPSYKRVDAHMFSPLDLKLDPELSGRVDPPSDEDIQKRIDDFMNPKVGQLQSILIAKDDNGYPVIIDGHIRWMAAMKITERKQGPHEGGVFKLKCTYFVGTLLERYIATIKANIRKDPTPSDDGYNIARLVHNFGMSKEDVASRVYGKTGIDGKPDIAWVEERLAYAELVPEAREALKDGKVKPSQIAVLAKMSKAAQREKLKAAGDGKVTTAMLRDAPSNGNGNHRLLTSKQVISFWKPIAESPVTESTKPLDRNIQKLASLQVELLNGADPDSIWSQIRKLVKD